ncbi:hypothetical protein Aam_053_011 [Acidocella aminolytica 101 = DSM 11237]|uniref:Uncharacterized protein n=1 Tax=Acidocella aminolytica 101 = DSM 11237 TaxID=1120923 RepID=A0A0D6PFV9_9PROT|nr:hypothetical protein Aam_053_011 [Acidocella aminolytica 101 = DSM 11237]
MKNPTSEEAVTQMDLPWTLAISHRMTKTREGRMEKAATLPYVGLCEFRQFSLYSKSIENGW